MTPGERALDRLIPRLLNTIFALIAIVVIGLFFWQSRGVWTTAKDIVVASPLAAVRDARAFIPGHLGNIIDPVDLPPSLRIAGLRYATVHEDHIDLVIARSPDMSIGARIWLPHSRPHHDTSTRYRDIYFYKYDNDVPVSGDNYP